MIFVIRHRSFSVVLKTSYVKIQIFHDRSFTWFFFSQFLEILTTGSLEIRKVLQRQSVSIFWAAVHALHLTGFLSRLLGFMSFENKQCLNQLIHGFHRKHNEKKLCPHVWFAFCAGFYTTPLTTQKLCSATLKWLQ